MLERGRQIGSFTIDQRIARGSTGEIYRAFQGSMKREVALKIVPVDERMPDRKDAYHRFEREAEVIARLEHPHIVPLHAYGVWQDDFAYLALRYMRGGPLGEYLKRNGALPPDVAIKMFGQIALALDYAHRRGVVHRDIKPGNILLDELGNAYLTDFGLAKLMEMSLGWTESGTLVGTPLYASPEQIRDSDALNYRSDLYSFGVVVYHGLVGRPPFQVDKDGVMTLIRRQVSEPPPRPSSINPYLNREVDLILMKALEKAPEDRYSSAVALIQDLAEALNVPVPNTFLTPVLAPVELDPPPPPTPRLRLSRRSGVVFSLLLLMVVVAAVMVLRSRAEVTAETQYELLSGIVGTVEDSVPSNAEAALARQRLGERGFIGYIPCTLETEMTTFLARAMGDVAREYGMEYQVFDAHMDSYLQSTLIEDARRQGAQALIVCQIDARSLAPTLESAAAGGVILAFNAPPQVDEGAVIAADSSEMGRKLGVEAGEYIRDVMGGRARVLVINLPSSPSSAITAAAMEAALLQVAPEAEIVARHAGVTREDGRAIALQMHDNDIAYDVVLAVTDAAAFGVISLLEEQDIAEEAVAIFSVNGESLARQYVRQGHYLRATIVFDRETLARATMQAVIKMLGGGTLPRTILVTESEVITADSQSTMP